jgi:hypothetical protein
LRIDKIFIKKEGKMEISIEESFLFLGYRNKMPSVPVNKKLYDEVVSEAKKRFKVWPSAYASGWVVRRYKELGGTYNEGEKTTLDRWFEEKWVNVCELPKIVPCGRSQASNKDYPYCRPLKRVSKDTPKTVGELTLEQIEERCEKKRKDPTKKIDG